MKPQIVNVRIDLIDANPWRSLKKYPFVDSKIEALVRSIKDVGLWEGVIARKVGSRYELAFGHHRVHAARKAGLKSIPLIIRELDDEQMLGFMGRENLEDYNADFLCMLESWEAAAGYSASSAENANPVDIARLLGWVRKDTSQKDNDRMNETAAACAAASELIDGKYLTRGDLAGLSVFDARMICQRAQSRIDQLQRVGNKTGRSQAEIDLAKRQVGRGAATTAKEVKRGELKPSEVRGRVDTNAYREAAKAKTRTPLFAQFGKALADQLDRVLSQDSASERIDEICKVASQIELQEDVDAVQRVLLALDALEGRAGAHSEKLTKALKKSNVISVKALRG